MADRVVLDVESFTSPERLECQIHFDASFESLMRALFEATSDSESQVRIVDAEGGRVFPDQITRFMLWVQAKRDDPDVTLESFDSLNYLELRNTFLDGLPSGKARRTRTKKPPSEAASAGSTE